MCFISLKANYGMCELTCEGAETLLLMLTRTLSFLLGARERSHLCFKWGIIKHNLIYVSKC